MSSNKKQYIKSRIRELSVEGIESGYYLLLLRLREPTEIRVGALNRIAFPAGWYIYAGSALQSMRTRLARHFHRAKKKRWHIDHLTTHPAVQVIGAVGFTAESLALVPSKTSLGECALNQRAMKRLGGRPIARGFGASDCRSGCTAHFWYCQNAISLFDLARIAPEPAIMIPGLDPRE